MNKIICVIVAVFLFSSCKHGKFEKEENVLSEFLNSTDYLSTKKCVLLIPAMGCGLCTKDIIAFSQANYNNDNILFIYSDSSKKTNLLFKNILDYKKFIVKDENSELISLGLVENKPVAYFIKNNHVEEVIKFDDSKSDAIIAKIRAVID